METKYLKIFRLITMLSGIVFILLVMTAWINENWFSEWKTIQKEYKAILRERVIQENRPDLTEHFSVQIHQVSLEQFNRVDRCVSCHLGMDDPGMESFPNPHKSHPGDYLIDHSVQKFACTICHGGQGRALNKKEALATDPEVFWYFPILSYPYIQSSCGKCHSSLFTQQNDNGEASEGMEVFMHGQNIFSREGCLGCHKARNVGGSVGPDLTTQGDKTRHEYNFENIEGEQTIANWLKEHFKDPEMVSPGSEMLSFNLEEEELKALATFSMGLSKPEIPYEFLSTETLKEFKGERIELEGNNSYAMFCTACHGKLGEGKDYLKYETGVPSVFNTDFLSAASDDFIRFTILNGRSNKKMASWMTRFSGLTESELDNLTGFVWSLRKASFSWNEFTQTKKINSEISRGKTIFEDNCFMCHGVDASGDIGPGLNKGDFFKAASEKFIFNTIQNGRRNTAMPSWYHLDMKEMTDLLAYIQSMYASPLKNHHLSLLQGNPEQGEISFHYLCSRCHGDFGQGSTGPAIINKDFLNTADDYFLHQTISTGRAHTAMHGWSKSVQGSDGLKEEDISNIIAYLRSEPYLEWDYIYPGPVKGDESKGSVLFGKFCTECHGVDGWGEKAPALNNQEFLNAASNGYLMATISLGRENTRMPSWGRGDYDHQALSGSEREDLVAFLRAFQIVRIKR